MFVRLFLFLVSCLVLCGLASAQDRDECFTSPLAASTEQWVPLANVQVVVADYDLLRRDFSFGNCSKEEIDQWLVQNVGYISLDYLENSEDEDINTAIPVVRDADGNPIPRTLPAFRPTENYYYEAVFVMPPLPSCSGVDHSQEEEEKEEAKEEEEGEDNAETGVISQRKYNWARKMLTKPLLDVKGTGKSSSSLEIPTNDSGLMTVFEALEEFLWSKVVAIMLKQNNSALGVVPHYAVLDLGFDVTLPKGKTLGKKEDRQVAAGALVRAAECHPGSLRGLSRLDKVAVEKLLRKYGVSSCPKPPKPSAIQQTGGLKRRGGCSITVSGSTQKNVIDFGYYSALPDSILEQDVRLTPFTNLKSFAGADFMPDPQLRFPLDDPCWGNPSSSPTSWRHPYLRRCMHKLHLDWQDAKKDREAVERELSQLAARLPLLRQLGQTCLFNCDTQKPVETTFDLTEEQENEAKGLGGDCISAECSVRT
jgi:hypothetical protein